MKVFVTKYALSQGIRFVEGQSSERYPKLFVGPGSLEYYHDSEWHLTEKAAKEKAESMRLKKIESLKKQLAKLEKLKF